MKTIISYASIHSVERAKERLGISEKLAEKNISRAIRKGKNADSFSSSERTYLKKEGRDGCTAIAYDGYCYIINKNGFCVTVYELPAWFGKKKHFNGKERIRNLKVYTRNHKEYFNEFVE